MSFRYINPGYAELLPNNNIFTTVKDFTKNPKSGVMINGNSKYAVRKIVDFDNEFYCKYDFFSTSSTDVGFFIGNSGSYKAFLRRNYFAISFCGKSSSGNVTASNSHSALIHCKLANSEDSGIIEMFVDGISVVTLSHSLETIDSREIAIYMGDTSGYIGNIILSDEYINPNESVITLPTSGVVTDMTDNQDGTYTANDPGQTLLQTIDTSSLLNEYGRNSKITGIVSLAVPGYGTGLQLTGIDKINGTVTEHGTVIVPATATGGVADSWKTDLTIGDLIDRQVGWKVAT